MQYLLFSRALSIASDNLDFVCGYCFLFKFEVWVFDNEGPYVVAESVRMQVALGLTVKKGQLSIDLEHGVLIVLD